MSYTKHTWTDNEIVTAENFNNIENGIFNCDNEPFIANMVKYIENSGYAYQFYDKTSKEIIDNFLNGNRVIFSSFYENEPINMELIGIDNYDDSYNFYLMPLSYISENNYFLNSNNLNDQCVLTQYVGGGVE